MSDMILLARNYARSPFIGRLLDEFFDTLDAPVSAPPEMQVTVILADAQELDHAYGPVLTLGPSNEAPNRDVRFRVPREKVLGIMHGNPESLSLKRIGFSPEPK